MGKCRPLSSLSYVGRQCSFLLAPYCLPLSSDFFPSAVSQDLCTNAVRQSSGSIRCSSIIYKCSM